MDDSYDVIVVGAGGSGLAAAVSAAQRGGRVLVLEKQPQPGGTTGIAVGSYTAAGTRWQREQHIDDNSRAHAEDAGKFATPDIESRNNAELRKWFLAHAAETLDWLYEFGLNFVGPSPEPPNRVPRMHNVVPGAKAYIAALQLALQKAGGQLLCNAYVEQLMQEDGRVVGVCASIDGERQELRASRGVVLAAGDYANNRDIIARHKGERFRQIDGINPFAGGGGHGLAERAGAELLNMDVTYGPELRFVPSSQRPFQQWLPASGPWARLLGVLARWAPKCIMRAAVKRLLVTWQHPENALFDDGAILLNKLGRRFVDETKWPDREIALANQPEKIAWIFLDLRLMDRYSKWPHFVSTAPDIAYAYVDDYLHLRPDVSHLDVSLATLTEKIGLPYDAVVESIVQFNRYVTGKTPDEFGRTGDAHPLDYKHGLYVLLGPVKAYFTTTEGGAAINRRLQVLNKRGEVVPGLYAVGQNGLGGMILWGHGLHIAWAMTSGRLAGQFIMEAADSGQKSPVAG